MTDSSLFQYIVVNHIDLCAIDILICHAEIEVNSFFFLRFCTKYLKWLSKYGIDFIVVSSSTNAKKKSAKM